MKAAAPKLCLDIDIDLVNRPDELSFRLDSTTYRQEDVSIGQDFFRMEGVTISRGELLAESLDIQEVVGRGAFSTVRRAKWRKNTTEHPVDVAVKECVLSESSSQRRQMLLKELRSLNTVRSPSLVRLHGAFLQPESNVVTMVLEYLDRGSLEDFIEAERAKGIPEHAIATVAYQILSGLAYLHDPERRMLHRDLKPANVLIDSKGYVKLCDFGMATPLGEESLNRTVLGTTKFMAPERLRAKSYGKPSDIWSFGLIILECVSGENPWAQIDSIIDLLVSIEETKTTDLVNSVAHDVNDGLKEIIVGSLHMEPAKRIPARLLLLSPWFSQEQSIFNHDHAVATMKSFCDKA